MCLVHRATLLPSTGGRDATNEERLAVADFEMPGLSGVRRTGSGYPKRWVDLIAVRPSTRTAA